MFVYIKLEIEGIPAAMATTKEKGRHFHSFEYQLEVLVLVLFMAL